MKLLLVRHLPAVVGLAAALATPTGFAQFVVNPLVTDGQAAHPAQIADPALVNAWGVAFSPTSPFWVSSNGSGTAQLYRVDPATQATTRLALSVTIPGDGSVTGQVFNGNASAAFGGDAFLFVSEDGTVSGWRSALGSTAEVLATGSADKVYKGAAFATVAGNSYLYAANFNSGTIDVLGGTAGAPALSGSFVDPNLPSGYAPFNVQNLGGSLYVAYALRDATGREEVGGPGFGLVDRFDLQGNLIDRVATGGGLNAPWGLAIAPASFGALAGALLVGNFGDGRIGAFDAATHAPLGPLTDAGGAPLVIDGLWAIVAGNGGGAGSVDRLYFSAGPDDERHGLFGVLAPVPEPSTGALLVAGLAVVAAAARRRREGRSAGRAGVGADRQQPR